MLRGLSDLNSQQEKVRELEEKVERLGAEYAAALAQRERDRTDANKKACRDAMDHLHAAMTEFDAETQVLKDLQEQQPAENQKKTRTPFLAPVAKKLTTVTFGSLVFRKEVPVLVGQRDGTGM